MCLAWISMLFSRSNMVSILMRLITFLFLVVRLLMVWTIGELSHRTSTLSPFRLTARMASKMKIG